ncbi:MAG: zinc-binding dehydrogenase [Myxococcales bacterium]|nr:zinc-binding dehydrogenase [Myxococcales bacterium]
MEKVVIHRPGAHDRLRLEEHPDPEPGAGELRIKVAAIGVNYADCIVRMGLYASAREYVGWPITPGFEVSGEVDAVGEGVDPALVGARVIGLTRFGAYASSLVVPAGQVFPIPEALDLPRAAGIPVIALTAYYGLFELAHPRPGATVLIHSAAGGVGSALIQLAKIAGARVIGVVGASHKVEAARALGADAVIDKSREPLWAAAERLSPRGYDVVCDANGVSTLGQSYEHLAPTGKLVVYGFHSMLPHSGRPNWLRLAWDYLRTPRFSPLELTQKNRSVMGFNLSYLFDRQDILAASMGRILGWIEGGELRSPAVTTYPLRAVAEAQRALESGQTVGKLILLPGA